MHLTDVQHQPRAVSLLARALRSERLPHSYLFAGPDGVGKAMMAARLAQILLCSQPTTGPSPDGISGSDLAHRVACGRCSSCQLVANGTHPDLHVVRRELKQFSREDRVRRSRGVELSVDVVREFLIERCSETSVMGGAKVFLVHEAERLSIGAQNALLKTLEEPPPRTSLILLTSSAAELLPTTLSRCQLVPFTALPEAFMIEQLAARGIAGDEARFLARQSAGSLGEALRLAADRLPQLKRSWLDGLVRAGSAQDAHKLTLAELIKQFDDLCSELAAKLQERDGEASPAEAQRETARSLFGLLSHLLRDALWLAHGGGSQQLIHADQPGTVSAATERWTTDRLLAGIDDIRQTEAMLDSNVNVTLAVETLLNRLTA